MSDPFDEATQNASANAGTATATVPAGTLQNTDDPFATSSEYKGSGNWDYRIPFEDLEGKLVVMKPTSFDPKANKPENFRQGPDDTTREEYRVELWLLNGSAFNYTVQVPDPDSTTGGKIEKVINVDPSQGTEIDGVKVPGARFRSQSIPHGQLIQALKGVDKDGRLLIGIMSRFPTVTDARKGVKPEDVKRKRAEWLAAGARGNAPQSTWNLDDRPTVLTPELRSLAGKWWGEYRKTV